MTKSKATPPRGFLLECFDYDPETGILRWRIRPRKHFSTDRSWKTWNSRFANQLALIHEDSEGYLRGSLTYEGKTYYFRAHQLIGTLIFEGNFRIENIDHIDGNRLNNILTNLRLSNKSENQWNRKLANKNSLTKIKGVCKLASGRYQAKITVFNVQRSLGTFDTVAEASAAYNEAAKHLHGEFFSPSIPR